MLFGSINFNLSLCSWEITKKFFRRNLLKKFHFSTLWIWLFGIFEGCIFQMVEIFMKLIQLLIFFCQKIQFKSHKSRSFNGNHFSNMWVCFVLIFLNTFMCSFYTNFCVIFLHKFLCNFAKGQLSFLKISVCYLCFPFIVN